MKSTITRFWLMTVALAVALAVSGCGGGGGDNGLKPPMPDVTEPPANGQPDMPDVTEPPANGQPDPMPDATDPPANGQPDMSDLGIWQMIEGVHVGYSHSGYDLMASFDAMGANPMITAESPTHQPKEVGTWSGEWSAKYTKRDSEFGTLDGEADGGARINVTIVGSNVEAVLTYTGLDTLGIPGLPRSLSSAPASVTGGRFEPSMTVSIPAIGMRTYSGEGQFGGTGQKGVVGYVSDMPGSDFRSVFYGDLQQ